MTFQQRMISFWWIISHKIIDVLMPACHYFNCYLSFSWKKCLANWREWFFFSYNCCPIDSLITFVLGHFMLKCDVYLIIPSIFVYIQVLIILSSFGRIINSQICNQCLLSKFLKYFGTKKSRIETKNIVYILQSL